MKNKISEHLTAQEVCRLLKAFILSELNNTPFTHYITISLDGLTHIQYRDESESELEAKCRYFRTVFLPSLKKWFKRKHGFSPTLMYVFENNKHGIHCHIMIHLPYGSRTKLERLLQGRLIPISLDKFPITLRSNKKRSYTKRLVSEIQRRFLGFCYLIKGGPRLALSTLKWTARNFRRKVRIGGHPQGKVFGKRYGFSMDISPTREKSQVLSDYLGIPAPFFKNNRKSDENRIVRWLTKAIMSVANKLNINGFSSDSIDSVSATRNAHQGAPHPLRRVTSQKRQRAPHRRLRVSHRRVMHSERSQHWRKLKRRRDFSRKRRKNYYRLYRNQKIRE